MQRLAPHRLVHRAQFRDRELLAGERGRERAVLELGPGAFQAVGEDQRVVEGQLPGRARPLGAAGPGHPEVVHGDPGSRAGVAARPGVRQFGRERQVSHRDDAHPRVPAGLSVGRQLLEVYPAELGARLLAELPDRRLGQVFLPPLAAGAGQGLHEAARQGPPALERRHPPLHQQHVQRAVPDRQRHHVDGDPDRVEGPRVVLGQELRLAGWPRAGGPRAGGPRAGRFRHACFPHTQTRPRSGIGYKPGRSRYEIYSPSE